MYKIKMLFELKIYIVEFPLNKLHFFENFIIY